MPASHCDTHTRTHECNPQVRSPGGPGDPPRRPLELWLADPATGACRPALPAPGPGAPGPLGLGYRALNTVFDDYAWWVPGRVGVGAWGGDGGRCDSEGQHWVHHVGPPCVQPPPPN